MEARVDQKQATDDLLFYNQVIFDIHELYTRKLRQAFMSPDFDMNDIVEGFNRLVEENRRALEARLNAFQRESQMGSKAPSSVKGSAEPGSAKGRLPRQGKGA